MTRSAACASRTFVRDGSGSCGSRGPTDAASPGLGDAPPDAVAYVAAVARAHQDLLRRLSAHDERCLNAILAPPLDAAPSGQELVGLPPKLRSLVCLVALFACDAPTVCLRWAVERAECAGVDDEEIVAALLSVGSDIGSARLVSVAPRLAASIGCDIEATKTDKSQTVDLRLHPQ